MASINSAVSFIKFLPGFLICLLENGSMHVFLTEVRKPLNPKIFPITSQEIIPIYESNRNFGGLIKNEGIVKFTNVDQLLFIN